MQFYHQFYRFHDSILPQVCDTFCRLVFHSLRFCGHCSLERKKFHDKIVIYLQEIKYFFMKLHEE